MTLIYHPYDSRWVALVRGGGPDDYGLPAERVTSDGAGNPCRHCLDYIAQGAPMLICAARPFPALQPYAETGPIFLCADPCAPYESREMLPILRDSPQFLLKAYGADHRIIYGTGRIVSAAGLERACEAVLCGAKVAYVDLRSASNNCFQARVTRRR